jgi:glycosyltransferase involved in cell wall biosynthesis
MKVLWFTNTSSLYKNGNSTYNGGGWIDSLEQLIKDSVGIELAISFFHETDNCKFKGNSVTYYPILRKKGNVVGRLIKNWSCKIDSQSDLSNFLRVINDFNPDVIHVFGTEGAFGYIQSATKIPIVIHLQGLIGGIDFAYYPPGINKYNFLFSPLFFKNHILGNSLVFAKKKFEKQVVREQKHLQNSQYLLGRTNWDKSISSVLAPNATYYHIDEVLRPPFYSSDEWNVKEQDKVLIVSTLSNTIYKGIDLIINTAKLLKHNYNLSFEWQIVGLTKNDKLILFFEKQLKSSCKDLNINLLGKKNSTELISLLMEAKVFVHPSYIDNSSNSVCEAQMLGIPVIACDVGGISSLIENNVNGLLVPSNAPFELANSISRVVINDDLSIKLGQHARITAIERHNRKKIVSDILHIYKKISIN